MSCHANVRVALYRAGVEHFLSAPSPLQNLCRSGASVRSALCHRAGLARPLSRAPRARCPTDALACVTTALRRSPSARSPRDQPIAPPPPKRGGRALKAFPVPGRLAGSLPDPRVVAARLAGIAKRARFALLSLASTVTRLALQLILVKGFKLYSFQLPELKNPGIVIYCHYLPVSGLGNLRACCLPWMW